MSRDGALVMHAMLLHAPSTPLVWTELPDRRPGPGEIRVRVLACGVCRTDPHAVDGNLRHPRLPLIPDHEIVGRVDAIGTGVMELCIGQRASPPWLGHTCGRCDYCDTGHENLCNAPSLTGYTCDGGYATSAVADARFAFPLGKDGDPASIVPLLCAGFIG